MSQTSKMDKLRSQVDANIKGGSLAFDALIGPLSKDAGAEKATPQARQEDVRGQGEETGKSPAQDNENVSRQETKNTGGKTTIVENTIVDFTTVKTTIVEITSNYCRLDLDVSDRLAGLQTPAEQSIYGRLYRLSYGEGKNTCQVGMTRLVQTTGIKSPKTIARAIERLVEKGHIAIVDNHHNNPQGGTTYRVFLPGEIDGIKSKTKVRHSEV